MTRKIHLLFALFMTPWVLMYALSAIAMQHFDWFYGSTERVVPAYEVIDILDAPFSVEKKSSTDAMAVALLKALGIEGAYRSSGSIGEGRIEIKRNRPIGSYRLTWVASTNQVTVEKQEFSMTYFLEMLHRRRGFDQPYWANDAWAVIVDLVIVAILVWATTGLMMWWKIKRTHKVGTIAVLAGSFLFACFIFTI